MCKVCSSLGQKWGNERAITGINIILTCPLCRIRRHSGIWKWEMVRAPIILLILVGLELPLCLVVTVLECRVTFSGVKLSIRSFVLFQDY